MIRSVKITTKYANNYKLDFLASYRAEYSNTVKEIVKDIWENTYTNSDNSKFNSKKFNYKLDSNLDNEYLKKFDYGVFTQRQLQAAGTQASSIIRSCTVKYRKQKHVLKQMMKKGEACRYLQKIIDQSSISMPEFEIIEPQIDNRFFDIQETEEENSYFDCFIQLRLFKDQLPIRIPFKKHKKYQEFEDNGKIMNSIRIGKNYISLSFNLPDVPKKKPEEGIKVGADQGLITVLTMSDGQTTIKNKHGHDLYSVIDILNRRKYGSKGFQRAQAHRENIVNWSINQLNFSEISVLNLEGLFQVRKGKTQSKQLNRFTYALINQKLDSVSEKEGFSIVNIPNFFRSQRCSAPNCGWTQKSNRKGKAFVCKKCGNRMDSDVNASLNMLEDELPFVPKWVREEKINRKGFYWNKDGFKDSSGELIVPRVKKESMVE